MDSGAHVGARKAQVQPITMIIIAGIAVGLVGLAYGFGMPLIEKGSTINDYDLAFDFIKRLDNKITSVANSMAGEESIDIPKGLVTLVPYDAEDPDNNTIILEFVVPQPLVVDGDLYLDTRILGEVAAYGFAEPRTIQLSGEWLETRRNVLRFKLHYRELDTDVEPEKGYKIMLNDLTSTGTRRVVISFDSTRPQNPERTADGARNGGELIATHINILLE
jgi:hypothetical protein